VTVSIRKLVVLLCLYAGPAFGHPRADLVLRGGHVYCMDPARSQAQALAISHGRLVFVGANWQAQEWIGPHTRVLELRGRTVVPGFCDAHVHPLLAGLEYRQCPLSEMKTASQLLNRVQQYAQANPKLQWIIGGGWSVHLFPGNNPTRQQLDAIIPDRPVCLEAFDGHSLWLNSRALEICGINATTPDPEGGRIERDAQGAPSGSLREKAMNLAKKYLPRESLEERKRALRWALGHLAQFGITQFQDANGGPEDLAAYRALEKSGELKARVVVAQTLDSLPSLKRYREIYRGRLVRPEAVKIFLDGVIETRTAALLEPYVGSSERGELQIAPEALNETVKNLSAAGFQVHIHAIGDRAVRVALDSFERLPEAERLKRRHTIAHLQVVDPADLPRFAQLGVVPNVQAFWAQADEAVRDFSNPLLGPPRADRQYPLRDLFTRGIVAAGSDWSVSTPDPIQAMAVAAIRHAPGTADPAWIPEQRVPVQEMLAAYTCNGAFLNHCERERGSLEVGKFADLVVLSHDLLEIPPSRLSEVKVQLTMFEGRIIFSKISRSSPTLKK
jgi:predicted amidohydrolase YtcJ